MAARDIISWKAWYDDGKTYCSNQHSWTELPDDGMLLVLICYEDGRKRTLSGADYYFMAYHEEGTIFGTSMEEPSPKRYRELRVKKGRWAPDSLMEKVEEEARSNNSGCDC